MKSDWKNCILGDCLQIVKTSVMPKEQTMYSCFSLPAFDNSRTPEILDGKDIKSSKFVLTENTILFNKLNPKFRRIWNVHSLDQTINPIASTEFLPLKVNSNISQDFLYYYISSPSFTALMDGIKTGTSNSQQRIDWRLFLRQPIYLPPSHTQCKIARILTLIDDKIHLNQQINKNLEQQIRTLCNAWLNEYAPFGGSCPNDWELTPLASFAKFISGYSYKGGELQDSTIAMATIKNFDRKGGFKLDGYKEIIPSSKLKPEHHAELFDTLVAHTDLTQNAEVIGNAEPVLSFSGYNDIIFSMDVVKVVPDNPAISKFLIAAMLQTQQFKGHCLGYVNGTTVLHLSKRALPEYSLRLPRDFKVLQPLNDAVSSMYQQMALNIDESVQLAALRDSLLPKLMSSELDVSGIDL